MTKVAVIIILSSEAAIGTEIEPSWTMALLFVDTCFDEVWSKFIINSGGISCFSTRFNDALRKLQLSFFAAPAGNLFFPFVVRR